MPARPEPPRSAALSLDARDRLQPSLLDRLIDDAPAERQESSKGRVLSRAQLRSAVLRDLSWLFNAVRPEPEPKSAHGDALALWAEVAHARRSVLNFGLPAFAGVTVASLDAPAIERCVAEAIRTYEPRIDARSLEVDVRFDTGDVQHNTLAIVIRGQLWSRPVPLELLLAADMDIETGHARVRDVRP